MEKISTTILAAKLFGISIPMPFLSTEDDGKSRVDMQRVIEAIIIALVPAAVMWGVLSNTVDTLKEEMRDLKTEVHAIQKEQIELKLSVRDSSRKDYERMSALIIKLDRRIYILERREVKEGSRNAELQ